MGSAGLKALVRGVDYRRLLLARLFSQFGDGAFQVGLVALFFFSPERQTTPAGVAWALVASLLPYTVIGPFAGVLFDRWYRRTVLIVANLARVVLMVGAAALTWAGAVDGWLLALVLSCMSVGRFVLTGLGASLPHVVAKDNLVLANAVTPTFGTIASVVGGAVSFGLNQALGGDDAAAALALGVPIAAYLLAVACTARLRPASLGPDGGPQRHPLLAQVADLAIGMGHGGRHLWQRREARWSMVLTLATRIPFGLFVIVAILLSRNSFTDTPTEAMALVAIVAGLAGVGSGLAAVVVPIGTRLVGMRRWTIGCLVVAGGIGLLFAAAMSREVLIAAALPLGLAAQGVKVGVDTTLQLAVDDHYLGRAFALYDMVFNASMVVAATAVVLLVPPSGHSPVLWVASAALLAVVALRHTIRPAWRPTNPTTNPTGDLDDDRRKADQ